MLLTPSLGLSTGIPLGLMSRPGGFCTGLSILSLNSLVAAGSVLLGLALAVLVQELRR